MNPANVLKQDEVIVLRGLKERRTGDHWRGNVPAAWGRNVIRVQQHGAVFPWTHR